MSEFQLFQEIVSRSEAEDWETAKGEWTLEYIHEADEFETCICGHYPIRELCVLKNRLNRNRVTVGNHCVKKFLDINADPIFDAYFRVSADRSKAFNKETIDLAHDQGVIDKWQHEFYSNTWRKRKLTDKQLTKREEVNELILNWLQMDPPR